MRVASFFIFPCYALLCFTARLELTSDSAMASAVPMMECVPAGDSDERLNLRPEAVWPLSIACHLLVCFMLVLPLYFTR